MTERLNVWWRLRSVREQRLLLVMIALVFIVLLWIAVVRPIQDAQVAAYTRHEEAVAALGSTRADARAFRSLSRTRPSRLEAPLATVVGTGLSGAGFETAGVAPQGTNRVNVTVASARPGALFALVADFEARGILVERLVARANADPTLSIDMTLIGRSR